MNETLTFTAVIVAVGAAGWAALLALAEESPTLSHRSVGDAPGTQGEAVPLQRALHISRLALLVIAAAIAGRASEWWLRPALEGWSTALIAAGFLYMLGDALPRALGALAPEVAAAAAVAARRTLPPFRPLIGLVEMVERAIQRVVPAPATAPSDVGMAQRDMLLGVFSIGDTTVAEVMTPRLDVVAVDTGAEWSDVVDVLRSSEHARLPVYSGTLDNITGIVHAKDLVPGVAGAAPVPAAWQDLVRPVQFVPETKTLAAQLRDFQRGLAHMAIVVDEFGGTSGLITLEDTLEEIVGEIHDEYDVDEPQAIERDGDDRFWVDGRVTLDEVSATLGASLEREDVSTVGGLVYSELGRVPRPGEELRVGGFRIVVEQVVKRRVRRVYFEREEAAVATGPGEQERE